MAGKGGGAWKVAYADFVTAMMAFFMVMWLVGQKQGVKEAVAEYFSNPPDPFSVWEEGRKSRAPGIPGKKNAPDQDPNQPQLPPDENMRKAKPVRFVVGDRSNVGTMVFFDDATADLNDDARLQLKNLVPLLTGKPQKIEVRGHASRRPLPAGSSFSDAWQLSYARSAAVLKYLEELGIPADRIRLSQAAGNEPLPLDDAETSLAKSARVEVFLLNEIAPPTQAATSTTPRSQPPKPS